MRLHPVAALPLALALAASPALGQKYSGPPGATASGATQWRPLSAYAADVLNGRDFGMKCDAASDDTAALQAAVNAAQQAAYSATANGGGILQLPPGFCIISGTVNVTGAIKIVGAGRGSGTGSGNSGGTVIRDTRTTGDAFAVNTADGVTFRDLVIDDYGNPSSYKSAGACISLTAPARANVQSHIDNVRCTGFYDGIREDEASQVHVSNFHAYDLSHDGILKINSAAPDSGEDSYSGLDLHSWNRTTTGTEALSPFATTSGSNVVTVTHATTGLVPGMVAVWSGGQAIAVNGTTISGWNVIQSIVDATHLTINGAGNASSTGSGGGTPAYWYGPFAGFEYRAGGDIAITGSKLIANCFGFVDNATYGPTGSVRILGNSFEGAKCASVGLVQATAGVGHANMSVVGNEFEDAPNGTAVYGLLYLGQGTHSGGPWFANLAFSGNHSQDFATAYTGNNAAIQILDGTNIAIVGNALNNDSTAGPAAISVGGNVTAGVKIEGNQLTGFTSGTFGSMNWAAVDTGRSPAPNLLVNPGMAIDQANEGASTNVSGAATYAVDGWFTQASTAASGITAQRVAVASGPPAQYAVKVTVGTGSATVNAGDYLLIRQKIEANQLAALGFGAAGAQTVALSYWVNASVAGTYGASLQNSTGARSNVENCTVAANTWTQCAVVALGDTSGSWTLAGTGVGMWLNLALEAGSSWQTTAPGIWVGANQFATASQTQLTTTTGATFQLTAAKLEVSPVPTPFVPRNFATELALDQRYYAKTFPQGTMPAQNGGLAGALCAAASSATAGTVSDQWEFPVAMRASPTVTTYNPSAANANWRDVTGASDAVVTVDPTAAKGATGVMIGEQTTALTVGHTMCIQAVADARL